MQPSQLLQTFSRLDQLLQSLYIRCRSQLSRPLRDSMVDDLINALADRFLLLCLTFRANLRIKNLRYRSLLLRIRKMIDNPRRIQFPLFQLIIQHLCYLAIQLVRKILRLYIGGNRPVKCGILAQPCQKKPHGF